MTDATSGASFEPGMDPDRRNWIIIACGAGAVGGAAVAVPFVSSFAPSERARAAGAPVQVDISAIQPGEKLTVEWRGKPGWILRRTPEQLATLPKVEPFLADPASDRKQYPTPDYAKNPHRSIKEEFFVGVGICSHLGGFLCPCHGSTFDVAGRVFKNKPAPDNLEVPPHMYLSDTVLLIGEDKKA